MFCQIIFNNTHVPTTNSNITGHVQSSYSSGRKLQLLFVFFWVIPRRLIYICRRFGTLYLFHLRRLPLKMEQIECSETSAYINQMPGNHPKENKQHSEHGESLRSISYSCLLQLSNIMPLRTITSAPSAQCHLSETCYYVSKCPAGISYLYV